MLFLLLFFLLLTQVVYFYCVYQVLQVFFLLFKLCVSLGLSLKLIELLSNSSVNFPAFGRKSCLISIFDRVIVSRGSWRLKTWYIVYFKSFFGGPDKFILSVKFYFSNKRKRSFFTIFVWLVFIVYCFNQWWIWHRFKCRFS